MISRALVVVLLLGASACAGAPDEPPQRTAAEQRVHDSILGESRLPGAPGIRGAVRAADSADARRALEATSSEP